MKRKFYFAIIANIFLAVMLFGCEQVEELVTPQDESQIVEHEVRPIPQPPAPRPEYEPEPLSDDIPATTVISAGRDSSFAILSDGSLVAWGNNDFGQLGVSADIESLEPRNIIFTDIVAVSTNGALLAWGCNLNGQLGYMPETPGTENFTPPVRIMENVRDVAVGWDFTAVVRNDGSLWTWGGNEHGNLGYGTFDDHQPTPVRILENVAYITGGGNLTGGRCYGLAITNCGRLYGWGNAWWGLLGSLDEPRAQTPFFIMDDVISVSVSERHAMAARTDGSLYGWGYPANVGEPIRAVFELTPVEILRNVKQSATQIN